ncbi:hypothetical protein PUR71_07750 [Streptomyces sp. SP17BM10]|uniref:hypothetical protein n=1 Tax=Streptomyces sp. SP17BM10 TaxID=3002530 RepID=UPI002E79D7B6|nr:hypothetical protein [Streptomyces sp. SP17BM10]MEE1782808.1 hypothetical protein [Streptomyces sp. SP17BM10]
MPSPRRGRPLAALLLVPLLAPLALTAGCASGPAAPGAATARPSGSLTPMDPPRIGDVPRLTEAGDRTLPIEAYLLSGEQFRQYDAAQTVLVTRCVRGFGLEYARPAGAGSAPSQSQTSHRYDPVELADVSVHGYHAPDPGGARKPSGGPSMSPELTTVLGTGLGPGGKPAPGSAAEFRGKALPPGGCVGAAQRELTARGGTGRDADVAVGINYEGFERSMTDPRVKTVFQDWSRCMGDRGYSYATPGDALKDSRWAATTTPSAEEIATATADVDCKARTNVVGVWFTVETAYENELIRQHLPELTAVKAADDAMLELARSVTATGS